jgi:hypothetical protein
LRSSLENRLGAGSVFRDVDVIEPGQDFVDTIEARVRACRVFLALIGQEWIDARNAAGERRLDDEEDYLRREVAVALARPDLRVIPVLVEGAAVPGTTQLPPDRWALSRRHAVSLRDETWEADVDRLTEAVRKVVGQAKAEEAVGRGRPRRVHPALWTLVGAAAVIVAIALPRLMPGGDVPSSSNVDGASSFSTGASVGDRGTRVALPAEGVTIAIPRISEIEMGEQIYSLVAGSLAPRGDSMTLRLRFRTFNESRYDHAPASVVVRLTAGSEEKTPITSFDGLLPGRTVLPGDVTFVLPRNTATALLQLSQGDESGELPLDLAPGGPLVTTAQDLDTESRSVGYPMYFRDEPVLLEADGRRYVLLRVNVRQFANKNRVAVTARLDNDSRYSESFGRGTFRLALEDGTVLAPAIGDDDVVEGRTTRIEQVVFEVPTTTVRVILRTIRGDEVREFPVELTATGNPG